ncbi:MAG: LD-carboxypeptidase [Candidatus Neomarinimicrobiota bacterium]|nr:MAG: LD-carboxypeptidase [Candidatus Neomarinimicrobiota bacterium]
MVISRRAALKTLAGLPLVSLLPAQERTPPSPLLPERLQPGDKVGLINPAGRIDKRETLKDIEDTLRDLKLVPVRGNHLRDQYGYLAGTDADRAEDIHRFFRDESVKALLAARGGWGCNRLLPLLDYDLIRSHPKIVLGYSDITSLLVALHARTGLVTFHGPVGISTWNAFTRYYVQKVLFEGRAVTFRNDHPAPVKEPGLTDFQVITPGTARGRLWGGNCSVLSALIGTGYLPDPTDTILFLEEVEEEPYRIDRMLTQFKLAGILDKLAGFIWGQCTRCEAEHPDRSLSLADLMQDHIAPLGIPAFSGFLTGHIENKFTLPIGLPVTLEADRGRVTLLQPAVR